MLGLLQRYALPRLVLVLASAVYFASYFLTPERVMASFLHLAILVFHEAGHLLMMPFGPFMVTLGGTLWQLVIPLTLCAYFVLTRQTFAAALILFLAAFSLLDASIYVADARARQLPLLGGDVSAHDWWNLLGTLGLLRFDRLIARLFFLEGVGLYLLALWFGLRATVKVNT